MNVDCLPVQLGAHEQELVLCLFTMQLFDQ